MRVPPGFSLTADAFRRAVAARPSIDEQLDRLSLLTSTTGMRSARSARKCASLPTRSWFAPGQIIAYASENVHWFSG